MLVAIGSALVTRCPGWWCRPANFPTRLCLMPWALHRVWGQVGMLPMMASGSVGGSGLYYLGFCRLGGRRCKCPVYQRKQQMDNYQIARRAQIGVVIPSTNTGVECDPQKFALDGVTWHPSRFWIELRNWSDEVEGPPAMTPILCFERFLEIMRGEIPIALRNVISAKVNHIMLGMSAETPSGRTGGVARSFERARARAHRRRRPDDSAAATRRNPVLRRKDSSVITLTAGRRRRQRPPVLRKSGLQSSMSGLIGPRQQQPSPRHLSGRCWPQCARWMATMSMPLSSVAPTCRRWICFPRLSTSWKSR